MRGDSALASMTRTCEWINQNTTTSYAKEYYEAKSRIQNKTTCSCPPCGEVAHGLDSMVWSHNGYCRHRLSLECVSSLHVYHQQHAFERCSAGTFLSNPGPYCSHPPPRCGNHSTFVDLASSVLRGKRVLIYGNSVSSQWHFAANCDLLRHGFKPRLTGRKLNWPSFKMVYYKHEWHKGIFFQSFNLNLTLITTYQFPAMGFCQQREQELKQATRGMANQSEVLFRFCRTFWEALARDFDVIVANVGGIEYKSRALLDQDLGGILSVLARAAAANESKRFIIADNAAQHFGGTTDKGLYEDRDERLTNRGCYCSPARSRGGGLDWRNALLHQHLANASLSSLRLLRVHNLTYRQWDAHVARAHPEHSRPFEQEIHNGTLTKAKAAHLAAVCDCTQCVCNTRTHRSQEPGRAHSDA